MFAWRWRLGSPEGDLGRPLNCVGSSSARVRVVPTRIARVAPTRSRRCGREVATRRSAGCASTCRGEPRRPQKEARHGACRAVDVRPALEPAMGRSKRRFATTGSAESAKRRTRANVPGETGGALRRARRAHARATARMHLEKGRVLRGRDRESSRVLETSSSMICLAARLPVLRHAVAAFHGRR